MKKMLRTGLMALLLLLGWAFPAAALDIHIDNSQDLGGSLALRYLRADGVWVTKGWVNFAPHSKQTVTLETWEPVFYLHVEVGGSASVELPGKKHRFWVVRDVFELEGDARPAQGHEADFVRVEVQGDDPAFHPAFLRPGRMAARRAVPVGHKALRASTAGQGALSPQNET